MENKEMTFEEKLKKFSGKNARERFYSKTPIKELPIKMGSGSSTHHPEAEGGFTTCDFKFWLKFLDSDWFIPYDFGTRKQILALIDVCANDNQIISLMELLAAKRN